MLIQSFRFRGIGDQLKAMSVGVNRLRQLLGFFPHHIDATRTSTSIVADVLRRQKDQFIELADIEARLGQQKASLGKNRLTRMNSQL
ncbi:hypothetical protein [Hyphomicrobium sp. DY-1]|uniref:hypothetical protein n=1 Tax=Hyphomicrobium sp. DY-1 TaxID=3075650 RepID=UPI0039C29A8A